LIESKFRNLFNTSALSASSVSRSTSKGPFLPLFHDYLMISCSSPASKMSAKSTGLNLFSFLKKLLSLLKRGNCRHLKNKRSGCRSGNYRQLDHLVLVNNSGKRSCCLAARRYQRIPPLIDKLLKRSNSETWPLLDNCSATVSGSQS
jgi:hypothetical protein